jgi:hypothetical protein
MGRRSQRPAAAPIDLTAHDDEPLRLMDASLG